MSLATWKAEFYPVDAADVSAEDAAAHSLRKWEGLLPEALKRHGVKLQNVSWEKTVVGEDGDLSISGSSCALCAQFYDNDAGCDTCPLFIARGGFSCDWTRDDEGESPWRRWTGTHNPASMIHWLKVTVEAAKAPEAAP